MGNDYQIKLVKRNWVDRATLKFKRLLDSLSQSLVTETGFLLSVDCPHCKSENTISEPMSFGKVYEISCGDCRNKFTVVIPNITVRPGLVEEVLHGPSRSQS